MARSTKKYAAYRKVCEIIGQPVADFADHLRKIVGEKAESTAHVVTYDPSTDKSYVVTVAAAGCDRPGDEEFILTLAEGGSGGTASARSSQGDGVAAASATAAAAAATATTKRTLFKGRVQLPPPPLHSRAQAIVGRNAGGMGAGGRSDGRGGNRLEYGERTAARRQPPVSNHRQSGTSPGLSSIAGVCMLCAVAAAGGIAFYTSYMSQTAEQGTIEVIRADIVQIGETGKGRILDLEMYASHTSCVTMFGSGLDYRSIYEEGPGCDKLTRKGPLPEATSYGTDTGVHITVDDLQILTTDTEWVMLEISTDTASIIHPVRVTGAG